PESSGSVWDYYIRSEDIKFEAGKNYTVSVDLKADKASVVAIAAARADMFFTVGTDWATYTFETGYLEAEISNANQNCITIGSGLIGKLSVSNLVITSIEKIVEDDKLPTLSFYIEKAGIDAYLSDSSRAEQIIEVTKAKDETETKLLGYKLKLNSTHVSLQLRDYAPVSENKLNKATFNLATDNENLNSAVVASVDNLSNDYVNYWNTASVIGENKDCEVCFPSYSKETSGLEQCAVEGITKDGQTAGNTITITNFSITNVADLANTGKTFAISINDKFNYSDTLPFTQEVTVPAENSKEATFNVLLGDKVGGESSFNWDNVTRFLYQKTSDEFIDNSNVVKYVIAGDQNSPTYKLVNESESDVTCIITLTKDLKVEIKEKGDVGSQSNPITDWETLSQLLMGNSTNEEVTLYVAGEFHVSSILQTCSPANIIPVGDVKFTRGKDVDDGDFSGFMFQHEGAMNLALGSEAGMITFSEDEVQTGSTFIDSSAESLTLTNCVFQNSLDGTEDIRISGNATAVYLNGTINIGNIFFSSSEVTPIYVGNLSADSLIGITLSEPEKMLGKTILQPIEGNTVNLTNFKLLNDDYTITNDFKIAEVSTELTVNLQDETNNLKQTIGDYIDEVAGDVNEKTIRITGVDGDVYINGISEGLGKGSSDARINLDLSGVTGLSEIPESAFKGCENLVSITIPAGVTTIGDSAFEDCKNLANITLPDCLVDIGDEAFLNCENLEYTEYSNGYYLGNADNPYLAFMSSKEATVTSIEINNATKIIAASAFAYCNELAKINIPNSVVTIGAQSFYNCFALTSITIPSSVTKIGVQAFYRITDNCDVSYPSVSFEDTNGWYCFDYDDNGEEKKTSFDVKDTDNFENYCYNDWFKDVQ
ncbi:MAG: leucine-rich repeat domain-containing protein, partial [Spirochaetota bacterium]|nr:leucine-rich repeat domain-containing protein [Spirochaetota bacterium]